MGKKIVYLILVGTLLVGKVEANTCAQRSGGLRQFSEFQKSINLPISDGVLGELLSTAAALAEALINECELSTSQGELSEDEFQNQHQNEIDAAQARSKRHCESQEGCHFRAGQLEFSKSPCQARITIDGYPRFDPSTTPKQVCSLTISSEQHSLGYCYDSDGNPIPLDHGLAQTWLTGIRVEVSGGISAAQFFFCEENRRAGQYTTSRFIDIR